MKGRLSCRMDRREVEVAEGKLSRGRDVGAWDEIKG